jgi:hypothetical protein
MLTRKTAESMEIYGTRQMVTLVLALTMARKPYACLILFLFFILNRRKGTEDLLKFLESNGQQVTHFLIGSNIIYMPDSFTKMFEMGHDIAVHTWTHPHMTTQSNLQVVAEVRGVGRRIAGLSLMASPVGLDNADNSQLDWRPRP